MNTYKYFVYVTCKYSLCEIQTTNYRSLEKYTFHVLLPLKMLCIEKEQITSHCVDC